jgi:hypothetical protein
VTRVNTLLAFQALAEARALLFKCCEYNDLGEAIVPLMVYAHERGIAEEIGADGVMGIIKQAFADVVEPSVFEDSA